MSLTIINAINKKFNDKLNINNYKVIFCGYIKI